MKKLFLALTLLLTFAWATPASAELKFGVVGGLNLSKMSFSGGDKGLLSSDNRCGWYIGPKAQFTLPLIGLGLDASGLTLLNHLQVGAGYNFGIGKWAESKDPDVDLNAKANTWQVQVAYLF